MTAATRAILKLNIRTIPMTVWCFLPTVLVLAIPWLAWVSPGDDSGFSSEVDLPVAVFFSVMAGLSFLSPDRVGARADFQFLRHAEFLLTRPVSRVRAYLATALLFFLITLSPIALSWAVSWIHPTMTFSLYQKGGRETDAARRQTVYRETFPDSFVRAGASHDTLVVPNARPLAKGWQLWLVVLGSLGFQLASLPGQSTRSKVELFSLLGVASLFLLTSVWSLPEDTMEDFFFFFVKHWLVISVLTVGLFGAVQAWAVRRIRTAEVT